MTLDEIKEKRAFLRCQIGPLILQGCPDVKCRCGTFLPVWMAFRCYFCGELFCRPCAADHFEKRMSQSSSYDEARMIRQLSPEHAELNARLRDKESGISHCNSTVNGEVSE